MSTESSIQPGVSSYKLIRDDLKYIGEKPFRRTLVYRLVVPLPLAKEGVTLFSVAKNYTLHSITVKASKPFKGDASYILHDISDGETVGVVAVRAGKEGLFPIAVPNLPAGLTGPSKLYVRFHSGLEAKEGELVIQVAVNGPPHINAGLYVDIDEDGVPDELAEIVIPLPPLSLPDTFDDFIYGYSRGMDGVEI